MALRRGLSSILQKSPDDIVILTSLRTPITRSYKGSLSQAHPEEMLSHVLRAILTSNPSLPPSTVQDITIGTVLSELGGSKAGRMSALHSGFPASSAFSTVNRACASGLCAITAIAQSIATGMIDCGIGGGMESMSRNYGSRAIPTVLWENLRDSENQDARDCIMSMGLTSENVAARYKVGRDEQDHFAVVSHERAARTRGEGRFEGQTVNFRTSWREKDNDGKETGEVKEVLVDADDGIRANASMAGLRKLKPAFKENGTITAGNSSQISDGAAVTLLMRRSTATELGMSSSVIGKWAGSQVVGCKPDEMGVGPAIVIPKLLEATSLRKEDIGLWEINEAFASQTVYCLRALGLEQAWADGKVNPNGGAIALGHPLGATGARMLADLLPEMERQGLETGVVSMCVGTGMGMAALFVKE